MKTSKYSNITSKRTLENYGYNTCHSPSD